MRGRELKLAYYAIQETKLIRSPLMRGRELKLRQSYGRPAMRRRPLCGGVS